MWPFRRQTSVAAALELARAPDLERLPVLPAAEIFAATGTEGSLATIRSKCGFSAEHFDRTVMPVLEDYAEFVQQFPAIGFLHDTRPGGLLISTLEVVDCALTFRRGQILPKGAAPEDIMRLEHRWTYAVFVAALLHDIGEFIAGLHVTLYRQGSPAGERWTAFSGALAERGATYYGVHLTGRDTRDRALAGKLPVFLYQQFIPADALCWLSNDSELIGELMAVLAGEKDGGSGVIGGLVLRANAEVLKRHPSTGSNLLPQRLPRDAFVHECAGAPLVVAAQCESDVHGVEGEEFLADFADRDEGHAAKSDNGPIVASAAAPLLPPPIVLPSSEPPRSAAGALPSTPSETALRFMAWLKAGLAQGTLRFNEIGAMVHFVKEGMLLVSPKIFQQFLSMAGEENMSSSATGSRGEKDLEMCVQKQLFNANWHIRGENGRSILKYQVLRGGKPGASIFGVVIERPDRFVYPIPPANPNLVREASSSEV